MDQPTLKVSHTALTFAETAPSQPRYVVLTVAQLHTDTPVTISTDAPDYFRFASESNPYFSPSLTFTPSPTGSYVHVQYMAGRAGQHQGQLFIETPYESQTVGLSGRCRGALPSLRPALPEKAREIVRPRLSGRWVGLLGVALFGGLVWSGFKSRCELFPSLCTEQLADETPSTVRESSPTREAIQSAQKSIETERKRKEETAKRAEKEPVIATPQKRAETPAQRQLAGSGSVDNQRTASPAPDPVRVSASRQSLARQTETRPQRPAAADPASEESDLEKELNRNL